MLQYLELLLFLYHYQMVANADFSIHNCERLVSHIRVLIIVISRRSGISSSGNSMK